MNYFFLYLALIIPISSFAQRNVIIHGYVQDAHTGEKLIGATIKAVGATNGITTNKFGFFSLPVSTTDSVQVSYVGYQSQRLTIAYALNKPQIINLQPAVNLLGTLVIRQSTGKDTYQEATMGRFIIPLDMVRKAPALLGENDILKTIQLLPGVQAGTEGTVGLNVRGGSPDQNLVLLDGITLYNVNHLFGFFSVINTDAVAQADFLKGSIPARYGGRLSSVLDITMREGNLQRWKGSFDLSPIAGRLTIEGPIKKDVTSILLSARRTWLDALVWAGSRIGGNNNTSGYGFYDLNAKINHKFSEKDRLYLSFYTGQDAFSAKNTVNDAQYSNSFDWGNRTLGLRWNHVYTNRLFGNLTANLTNFSYAINEEYKAKRYYVNRVSSGIRDVSLRTDFDYFAITTHSVKFGGSYTHHTFSPEIKQFAATTADTTYQPTPPIQTDELTAYAEDDWTISSKLRANIGGHYANQFVNGQVWHSLQPRISARYLLDDESSIKVSYNQMTQFLHLLTNSSVGLPTDLWVPVTDQIPPEKAHWWSVGYSRTLKNNWNISVEGYYKRLQNVLDYKEGTSFQNNFSIPWYDRVSVGKGTSYGAEFYLEKTAGRTKGWLSYTLSKTDRQFDDINGGRPFPFKFDRRHNLAIVVSHDIRRNKTLSANFVFNTGTALTVAGTRYTGDVPGSDLITKETSNEYTWRDWQSTYINLPDLHERNNFRTLDYHRLDISYRITKQKKHGERSWVFSCYNLYNHLNPFYLYYDKTQLKQFSLFPAIPSITYQYAF
ncbi:TonB-dependent receptor [Fibrella forsythiae]|uniref:Carboxypeptidase-like regulatory domain-containing protein n=1 Tax=Fibrella forsythiae TaxID=2817061 RepID=A0ABS3JFQ0_9BACT|nr:carboxypeptidase-like regulatory domain-containing protein [Fibrella forsythiae]MBO0948829.1 carboxypeptidase-like regulatory domain-containing protein [Fibrella forsythiae]